MEPTEEEKKKKAIEELEREREIQELFMKTEERPGEQLVIGEIGELSTEQEIREFALGPIDNPEAKYDTYYKGIQKLLREYLPKGRENKALRDKIYEEKNTLLNRGNRKDGSGVRGSDGRMAYETDMEMVLSIIAAWILEKGTPFDLFTSFRNKNLELGYEIE